MFDAILGNQPIQAYLKRVVEEGRLPQTLLFSGIDGIGKSLFARDLAKKLLQAGLSTDFHILRPEGKSASYAIDTLREMMDQEHQGSYATAGKVFLLEDAHRMQPVAANALLKTLEEPSDDTTFILLSSHINEILPTIVSRCSVLSFRPLKTSEVETLLLERGLPTQFAKYAHGSIGKAMALAQNERFNMQRKLLFELLRGDLSYPEIMQKLFFLETMLEEEKEEDPLRFSFEVDQICSLITMWHRDQILRETGGSEELLFFPDEPKRKPGNLQQIETRVAKVRLAISRNMKVAYSLIEIFF